MKINLSKHNKIKKELFPSNKISKEILKIDKNNSDINTENIDKNYINDNIIKLKDILNNDGTKNIYKGLVRNSYFHDKILNKNLKIIDFEIENEIGDGNCGFRALSLQIYNNQNNYNIVRSHIYNYLNNNKESYNTRYMIYNNEIITADLYIPKIKADGLWMGISKYQLLI